MDRATASVEQTRQTDTAPLPGVIRKEGTTWGRVEQDPPASTPGTVPDAFLPFP